MLCQSSRVDRWKLYEFENSDQISNPFPKPRKEIVSIMVSTRARTVEIPSLPKRESAAAAAAAAVATPPHCADYERCREERIRENRERMMKMGIFDLASEFKSSVARSTPPKRRATPSPVCPRSELPPRRSSRLQHVAPTQYSEREMSTRVKGSKRKSMISFDFSVSKEEVYTDEHEALLGDCKSTWTLFVDGYAADGRRIYDPVNGKTCHQCRQKTMGHRTSCSRCDLVQGQFCGDCLYMRYGENVLEANENPDWVCPVCRDICNCSLCRVKKGWAPTGTMYKKALNLGYKSVAHFLIQTKRATKEEDNDVAASHTPIPAKRSLTFPDDEDKEEEKQSAEKSVKNNEDKEEEETGISPDSIACRLRSRVKASA